MWQTVVTALIVALAAAWVIWTVLLPNGLRARLRRLLRRPAPAAPGGCGTCGCGDKGA